MRNGYKNQPDFTLKWYNGYNRDGKRQYECELSKSRENLAVKKNLKGQLLRETINVCTRSKGLHTISIWNDEFYPVSWDCNSVI